MRHLFVVDSLDKHIQNEKELIRPRRILPAARATRARSAQFYVVLIRHDSTGVGGLFCICVESINLNLNPPRVWVGNWVIPVRALYKWSNSQSVSQSVFFPIKY